MIWLRTDDMRIRILPGEPVWDKRFHEIALIETPPWCLHCRWVASSAKIIPIRIFIFTLSRIWNFSMYGIYSLHCFWGHNLQLSSLEYSLIILTIIPRDFLFSTIWSYMCGLPCLFWEEMLTISNYVKSVRAVELEDAGLARFSHK